MESQAQSNINAAFLLLGRTALPTRRRPLEGSRRREKPHERKGACNRHCSAGDLPAGPAVQTWTSSAGAVGSIPGQGAKIPHTLGQKYQNIKQKQYRNKFSKDLKNGPHPITQHWAQALYSPCALEAMLCNKQSPQATTKCPWAPAKTRQLWQRKIWSHT